MQDELKYDGQLHGEVSEAFLRFLNEVERLGGDLASAGIKPYKQAMAGAFFSVVKELLANGRRHVSADTLGYDKKVEAAIAKGKRDAAEDREKSK